MALSGMTRLEELIENTASAIEFTDSLIGEKEISTYGRVVNMLKESIRLPCSNCAYCMPCPAGVDISACFSAYNESYVVGWRSGLTDYLQATGMLTARSSDASLCTFCGICEKKCPQHIKIASELKKVKRRMATIVVKPIIAIARIIMRAGN